MTPPEKEGVTGVNEESSNKSKLTVPIGNEKVESASTEVTEDSKDMEAMKVQLDNLADSSTLLLLVGILLLFSAKEVMMLVGQIHFVGVRARLRVLG